MSILDLALLGLVVLALFLAVRRAVRSRGSCSCGGDCSCCGASCSKSKENGSGEASPKP